MAMLIKVDGEIVEDYDVSSLEQLQEAVGGYIEIISLDNNMCLVVNEEGLVMGLKQNMWASLILNRIIVGDVIYMNKDEIQ